MAATLTLRKYTGTNAATESAAVTGADLISADNAVNTLANRQAFPVTAGQNSYETWLRLKVDAIPANGCTNFRLWGDGTIQASTSLMFTTGYITGTTPTTGSSTIANANFTVYTAGNKAQWDTVSLTNTNATTKATVFQLQVGADCGPGNLTQETVNYSWDET